MELVFQAQRELAEHFRERFAAGHGIANMLRFMIQPGLERVVLFLDLAAERLRLVEQLLAQIANLFGQLAVEIVDPLVEMARGFREIAADPFDRLRAFVLLVRQALACLDRISVRYK